jgi:DHA1 family multidrug resistance protein-like MFS transporter
MYSFAVYFCSLVYSPASGGVMEEFGVGNVAASLGLAMYVLAYMSKTG